MQKEFSNHCANVEKNFYEIDLFGLFGTDHDPASAPHLPE